MVAEAQLAVQRLVMAAVTLLLAQGLIVRGVFGVQQQLPEAVAHLRKLGTVVTQGLAKVAIAEDHPLAVHVLHVQLVGDVRTTSDQKLSRSSSDSSTCLRLVMSLMLRMTAW